MPKYYFTYGTDPSYPFQGGWTEIEAPAKPSACIIFKMFHPNLPGSAGVLNYAGLYTEEEFIASGMAGPEGNFGAFCQELILVHREEFGPKGGGGG